jgi:hypothetical protein
MENGKLGNGTVIAPSFSIAINCILRIMEEAELKRATSDY